MIRMKGVLAVPGEYEKDGKKYIKTAEELKKSAIRFPILPLTYGHTQDGLPPTEAAQIGTVSQKWNEEQQRILSEFWFDEEKMPTALRSKINDGHKIPISTWYLADSIDEDGTLHGMSYSHVAALEGEDPVCPIDQCGAFVVAESKGRLRFIEHAADLEPSEPKVEKEAEAPLEEVETPVPDVEPVEADPEEPKTDTPVEQKPTETDAEPEIEVPLEPEVIIPTAVPVVQKPFDIIDGNYVFTPDIFKQKQQEKK